MSLVFKDMSSFLKVYSAIPLGKEVIGKVIDYIYFNPKYPENQTLKFFTTNTPSEMVLVRTDNHWEQRSFNDISGQIYKNVERLYVEFFEHLLNNNINTFVVLNCTNTIVNIMDIHFGWKCDIIDAFELNTIESKNFLHDIIRTLEPFPEYYTNSTLLPDNKQTLTYENDEFLNFLNIPE
jgi:hypothetical protein